MSLCIIETIAGRGGPSATHLVKTVFPSGNVMIQAPSPYAIPSMPDCPGCNGLGITHRGQTDNPSVMDIVEGRAQMVCKLCGGQRQIPRLLFERITLDIALMDLEEPLE